MSQDEQETKQVETTTPPAPEETKQQEDNASDADETAKGSASEPNQTEVDYKGELEREQKRRKQAEYTIQELKKAGRQVDPEDAVANAMNSEGVITAEELTRQIESNYKADLAATEARIRKELAASTVEEELNSVSANPDEQELIRFHYENSIKSTGLTRQAITQDLKRARLLANESKLLRENEELTEALKAKNSAGNSALGSNQDKTEPFEEPELSPADRAVIKRLAEKEGLTMKEYIRRNKSRLTNE